MRKDILENLQKEVYNRCQKETNKFGIGCYYHIAAVVKNAEILAEEYGADKEVVMFAAWLHDIDNNVKMFARRCPRFFDPASRIRLGEPCVTNGLFSGFL